MTTYVPNHRESLVLNAARIVGEGNKASVQIQKFDILAFDVEGGRPMPLTVLGLPLPMDGSTYSIFSYADKSHTLLDGTRFDDFRAYADFLYRQRDAAAKWAKSGEAATAEDPRELSENGLRDADPARAGADSGDPEKRAVEPALIGMAVPSRWK